MHLTWVLSDLTELSVDDDDSSECLLDVLRALKGSDEEDELLFCVESLSLLSLARFFPSWLACGICRVFSSVFPPGFVFVLVHDYVFFL